MKPAPENSYGWTYWASITDMDDCNILKEQIESSKIPYIVTTLNMAGFGSELAYVISYRSTKTDENVSVLVVPTCGPDSWQEEYYYFVGLDVRTIINIDWYELLKDMRIKVMNSILKNIKIK